MRLPPQPGEWIDRSQPIGFRFEGRDYRGCAGDTVASALAANGVTLLGRSFKYHRPRGLLSAANHDVNAMMQWGGTPNLRADATPLDAGMDLKAINTFGTLARDPGSVLGHLARFLPVGFYYKAFHNKRLFPLWERMFRAMTGLGRVDFATPRLRTPKRYGFCDVLVVGGGPSGLAAALAAAEQGADVALVDEHARLGGSTHGATDRVAQVLAHPRIRVLTDTCAAGYYADHWVPLVERGRITKMRARALVVAAGAFEQPAVFRNNDLPGVMLASGAARLIRCYAVRPAQRVVVLAANADAYAALATYAEAGIEVAAVVDLREAVPPQQAALATARGIPLYTGHCLLEAVPTQDGKRVAAVKLARIGQPTAVAELACDGVFVSVGWAPAAALLYQAGTKMRYAADVEQFVPETLPGGVHACGRVNGVHSLASRLADGTRAGSAAAAYCGFGSAREITVPAETESPTHPWPIVPHPRGKNFVDFDEDLQLVDLENAIQEGFDNIELMKRFSTVGMGPSQGKHSNMNALRVLARALGATPGEVGTTTARPFFHPVPLSHLAGRGFSPERRTPMHQRHAAAGAVWMPAGVWQRPEYYARAGETREACIQGEVLAVRQGVGIIDVGTLGKLEIRGPQAAEFLERVYLSKYAGLKVGMTRYAVMCDEAGVVIDDGVIARLADDHFYFTTTTSGAAAVYRELGRWNTLWQLDCGIVNLTGAMAAMNLAGPKAKAVLAGLTDVDLALPFLAVREGRVAGVPARLMRVGFVGEWGVEIHVPADYGTAVWDALIAAGTPLGIRPFGVEAQRLLRLEKGHVIIGQDTDGLTTPGEAGLDWAVKMDKPFFVGQRSLAVVAAKPRRQQLVGFALATDHAGLVPKECHLVIEGGDIAGRVTSVAWSPSVRRHIGLAYVRPEMSAVGSRFSIRLSDKTLVTAEVVKTPFYDPDNLRQKESVEVEARPADGVAVPIRPALGGRHGPLVFEDASANPRAGAKGPGAAVWLAALGLPVPASPNSWLPFGDGLVARLGLTEFLVEGAGAARLAAPPAAGVYPVLRQDTALRVRGARLNELLLETCSVDFAALDRAARPVVLTSMAGVMITVIPDDDAGTPGCRIWCDGTWGESLADTLAELADALAPSPIPATQGGTA
ncbi:MAG: aminomethyltransferase [Hydrogenophilales bacterium 16-64-46]|nr:MAG: aminomethyltransferase [Hydrogenophilales bacterium 12-64-13]OYZ05833.1 MAG: aminomethyltransferase [Hydrogenophilales bacterium 16-64-46]OZA39768.1 MAG: aminomethyltransferase [Hydrogenophilales bacterium 17-64-34]